MDQGDLLTHGTRDNWQSHPPRDSSRLHHRLARPPSPAPLFEVENLLILESKLLSKSTLGQPFFTAFQSMQFLLVLTHILFPQVGVVPTANRCRSLREYSLLEFCDSISTSLPLILFLPGANTSDTNPPDDSSTTNLTPFNLRLLLFFRSSLSSSHKRGN